MAPKFALFTKASKLPLNQGFQNRFKVTTVSRQALEMVGVQRRLQQCSIVSRPVHLTMCLQAVVWAVASSITGRVIPNSLKLMVMAALLSARGCGVALRLTGR